MSPAIQHWRRSADIVPSPPEVFQEQGTPPWGYRLLEGIRKVVQRIDENGISLERDPRIAVHSGATADRPTGGNRFLYLNYFDTDLGIPIWWDGTNWIDATGATV